MLNSAELDYLETTTNPQVWQAVLPTIEKLEDLSRRRFYLGDTDQNLEDEDEDRKIQVPQDVNAAIKARKLLGLDPYQDYPENEDKDLAE